MIIQKHTKFREYKCKIWLGEVREKTICFTKPYEVKAEYECKIWLRREDRGSSEV